MRRPMTGLAAGAVVLVLLAGGNGTALAFIDLLAGSLAAECKNAQAVALVRVEKPIAKRKRSCTARSAT
jgi:hypothetical protein